MAIFFIGKITFGNNIFLLVKKIQLLVKKKPMGEGGLKKVVVVCGERLGDEKHVRIRKRKKKARFERSGNRVL